MNPKIQSYLLKSKDFGSVTTYAQIENQGNTAILRNQVSTNVLRCESRAEFSSKEKKLKNLIVQTEAYGERRVFEGKFYGKNFLVRRTSSQNSWWEIFENVPKNIVPFVVYGFSEDYWCLSQFKMKKNDQRMIPFLHTADGSEFSFEGFSYVFDWVSEEGHNLTIRMCNVFQGELGRQLECVETVWNNQGKEILKSRSLSRGGFFVKKLIQPLLPSVFTLTQGPSFPLKLSLKVVPVVFTTKSPMVLNIRGSGSFKNPGIFLFDILRVGGRTAGTQFLRQHFHSYWDPTKKFSTLTFQELWANSSVGPHPKRQIGKSQLDFQKIEPTISKFWNFWVKKEPNQPKTILVWKENAFLATSIFSKYSHPPRLILIHPFWGTLSEFLQSLKIEDISLVIQNAPSESLSELCKAYPGKILVLGPQDEKAPTCSHIQYFETSLEEIEAPSFNPPGPNMWNEKIKTEIEKWILAESNGRKNGQTY